LVALMITVTDIIPLKLKKKNSRTGKEQSKEDFKTDSYSRASLKQRGS